MFDDLTRKVERGSGSPWAAGTALSLVVVWEAVGPLFEWSTTWQLFINTTTTIITFLMVFLIQATQSRDTIAIHTKLDELIRVIGPARNSMVLAEDLSREDLETLREELQKRAKLEG